MNFNLRSAVATANLALACRQMLSIYVTLTLLGLFDFPPLAANFGSPLLVAPVRLAIWNMVTHIALAMPGHPDTGEVMLSIYVLSATDFDFVGLIRLCAACGKFRPPLEPLVGSW